METLKEFRNILLGYEIEVFTDHKNLTYESTMGNSQRAQRWRSLIQEFDVTLKFIAGEANIVADAISRLPKEEHAHADPARTHDELCALLQVNDLYVTETADCFATTTVDAIDFPLAPQLVEVEQKLELESQAKHVTEVTAGLNDPKSEWKYKDVEGFKLIHHYDKIYVPKTMLVSSLSMSSGRRQTRCHS